MALIPPSDDVTWATGRRVDSTYIHRTFTSTEDAVHLIAPPQCQPIRRSTWTLCGHARAAMPASWGPGHPARYLVKFFDEDEQPGQFDPFDLDIERTERIVHTTPVGLRKLRCRSLAALAT